MSKRVGFWFFTGDWMKDPELRFCSIFARGLLVDLLCLMFEAKRQGELSKPDGSPRSDEEIVDSVSGSDRATKLEALKELIDSGVLKRDENTGVLYSSRLRAIAEISRSRSNAGSKGGTSRQAKAKQTNKQKGKQNTGVTVSDSVSDSDSDTDINSSSLKEDGSFVSLEEGLRDPVCIPSGLNPELAASFRRWVEFRFAVDGCWMPEIRQEALLMELNRRGPSAAVKDIQFSIEKGAKNICDHTRDFSKLDGGGEALSYGERLRNHTGI